MDIETGYESNEHTNNTESREYIEYETLPQKIKKFDQNKYKKTIKDSLSFEVIGYLSEKTGNNYISKIQSTPIEIDGLKTNKVTIQKDNGFLKRNTKICEIIGYQLFHDFNGERPFYDNVRIEAKTLDDNVLSQKTLDNLLKDVKYDEILLQAENKYYHKLANSILGETKF